MAAGLQGPYRKTIEHAGMSWIDELGPTIENAGPWDRPAAVTLDGRYCRLVPLDLTSQADELWQEMIRDDASLRQWQYLEGMGPFNSQKEWVDTWTAYDAVTDNQTFAVQVHDTGAFTGQFSLLRIRPESGSAEVGFVRFPPQMQRTPASTEAQFLLADYILGTLGYRRYEWKCNDQNQASMRAAKRLGFTYEGTFRQDLVNHGRNRDTAWWSILDSEWPALKAGYLRWLSPDNFDEKGHQKQSLETCMKG